MPENYITLDQLTKTTKGLVNKINAESTVINRTMGDLANLTTTAKSNLVAAINEVASSSGGSSGGITTETDPVFTASAAAGITSTDISNWNAKSTFSGSYNDLTDKPTIPTVPTNVSDFTNDAGYLTSYTETDPTVPAWAKAASKPTYTAAEVGAASTSDLSNYVIKNDSNDSNASYITNDAGHIIISTSTSRLLHNSKIDANGSTVALKSWSGAAVGAENNANVITLTPTQTTIKNIITPTNDGDAANKKYVDDAISTISIPTDVSAFNNDAGYLTSFTETDPTVPAWAKTASKPTYTAAEVGALPDTYTAPVTSVNGQTGAVTLSIPAAQVQSDWNATSGMGVILNKPTIPAATTVTNTLASGTLIATINGTNIYAPAYVDADGVSY